MEQERVECPFCSELIMRGALKCRFCREWLSASDPGRKESRSLEETDCADADSDLRCDASGNVKADYLAAVEQIDDCHQPVDTAESRADSRFDTPDPDVDCTVEVYDRIESSPRSYRDTIENLRGHAEPIQEIQDQDSGLSSRDVRAENSQLDDAGPVEVSPMRPWWEPGSEDSIESHSVGTETQIEQSQRIEESCSDSDTAPTSEQDLAGESAEAPEAWETRAMVWDEAEGRPDSVHKGARIPWLRISMVVLYLGIIAALVVSESATHAVLRDAHAKEDAKEYDSAFDIYQGAMNTFPFSFATIEARRSLIRMCQSSEYEMPEASWFPAVKRLLGSGADTFNVHLLPLVAWPASAVLLFLVFATRIVRPRVALLALLLMIVATTGSIAQLVWYGSVSLPSMAKVAQGFMHSTPVVYVASYLLLVVTATMTLTSTAKPKKQQTAKPDELFPYE